MKKILLSFLCTICTLLGATAQTLNFTDKLVVTVDGVASNPQETTVSFSFNEDGTCNFSLPNFILLAHDEETGTDEEMPVGNIYISNLALTPVSEGLYSFEYNDDLLITEGDKEGVDMWVGPILGEIPLRLTGKATLEKIFVNIDIELEVAGAQQVVHVTFGDDNFSQDSAISHITATTAAPALYDLQGRRVSTHHNTITIMNGKKIIR